MKLEFKTMTPGNEADEVNEAEKELTNLVNYEIKLHDMSMRHKEEQFCLTRFAKVLNKLGDPQRVLAAIQVAGTNGKGSTVHYLQLLFMAEQMHLGQDCQVGAFFSPHLQTVHERIKINGQNIRDAELAALLLSLRGSGDITYFEALTAAAFLAFRNHRTKVAIIETGLGGRLDATSLVKARVGVITNVGLDHRHILGQTLGQILSEKLGIVHPAMDVVVGEFSDGYFQQIIDHCHSISIMLRPIRVWGWQRDFFITKQKDQEMFHFPEFLEQPLRMPGNLASAYLRCNFALALASFLVYHNLSRNEDKNENEKTKKEPQRAHVRLDRIMALLQSAKFQSIFPFRGRMEALGKLRLYSGKKIILKFDGCHNVPGIKTLCKDFKRWGDGGIAIFYAALKDKVSLGSILPLLVHDNVVKIVLWNPVQFTDLQVMVERWFKPEEFQARLLSRAKRPWLKELMLQKLTLLRGGADNLLPLVNQIDSQRSIQMVLFAGSLYSYQAVRSLCQQFGEHGA